MKKGFILALFVFLSACGEKEKKVEVIEIPLPQNSPSTEKKAKKQEQKEIITETAKKFKAVDVNTNTISGRKLGGLYTQLTGISGIVANSYTINFGWLLADMWHTKLDRRMVSPATITSADIPIKLYLEDQKKLTLKQFIAQADAEVSSVKKHLNFNGVCGAYALNPEKCKLLTSLAMSVRGVDIVAYGMTELMPSSEGDLNVKIMEILLKDAGSRYIFTIPALYDKMLSLGFYQFTSLALNGVTGVGASKVNIHLPQGIKIPGSVIDLRDSDHHRAAYLFAIHNFAELIRGLNSNQVVALKKAIKQKPGDIVVFMATSHHAPSIAYRCMRKWLTVKAEGSLAGHLVGRLKPYGKKSYNNLSALEKIK